MLTVDELLQEVERLPRADKWLLFRRMTALLEREAQAAETSGDYHEFLRQTFGSITDLTFQRHDQGEYEEREPFE
jgi:hypothetical protein